MHEIAPGLRHWTARHPHHGMTVSSYALVDAGVLLNPLLPDETLAVLDGVSVRAVVLTNRHHVRDAARFGRQGVALHAPQVGLDEVQGVGDDLRGYVDGDELPGGLRAIEIGELSPDEFAVHLPSQRAIATADGVMRTDDGPLGFFPDRLLGDDPAGVKRGLGARFLRLCDELDFEHLLLAHGAPVLGDGHERLRAFAEEAAAG